jgi:glyoxylase-like metal-dependent hydrolase (beta-lactamase superfamily II)
VLGDTANPPPAGALPVVTFRDTATFRLNGDEVVVRRARHAHAAADAIVHWRHANVVHMGDVFVTDGYPVIDVAAGGSVDGMIAAVDTVLSFIGDNTRVIPGRGTLSNRGELQAYRDMLAAVRERVREELARKTPLERVQQDSVTRAFDARWGRADSGASAARVAPEMFVASVYESLRRAQAERPRSTRRPARRPGAVAPKKPTTTKGVARGVTGR